MKKTLYFDLSSGAAGDMVLAALIDLGVPVGYLQEQFNKLSIPGLSIKTEPLKRQGVESTHILLSWEEQTQYRNIHKIMEVISRGDYSQSVLKSCSLILNHLASAEAKVHGVEIDEVHFHEIGAVDTIVDVLGASLCIEYLKADEICFSQLTVGQGSVQTAHGKMALPVPATAEMIKGHSVRTLSVTDEILTPTGCAILTALGTQDLSGIDGLVLGSGYGCGDKEFSDHPNLLRVFLLQKDSHSDAQKVCQIETDMDHISGEIMGHVAALLRKEGVLDLCWIPTFMKKGRPGYRLSFLCEPHDRDKLIETLIIHTRTLGVRWQILNRICAERQVTEFPFMEICAQEKHCSYKSLSFSKLEYESLAQISENTGIPILDIIEDYNRKA